MNKKTIALIVAIIAIVSLIIYFESSKSYINVPEFSNVSQSLIEDRTKTVDDMTFQFSPELEAIEGYINAEPGLKISDFRGKVVLIDFWTYSCINCIRTLPFLIDWHEKYSDQGLVIIGVHTPEFKFEEEFQNVQDAVNEYGIEYRVVLDNNYATWQNFKNRFWPRKYLIDAEGFIRYDHIGEGAYKETELKIRELLEEDLGVNIEEEFAVSEVEDRTPLYERTPELYAGYSFALPRGQNLGNSEGLSPGQTINYTLPTVLNVHTINLEGRWQSLEDNLQARSDNAKISLNFLAASVNIVAGTLDKPVELEVNLNGGPIQEKDAGSDVQFEGSRAFILIDRPKLYNVFNRNHSWNSLELIADSKDFNFNSFTFG